MCQYNNSGTEQSKIASIIDSGTNGTGLSTSCGTNDISKIVNQPAGTIVGDQVATTQCPNLQKTGGSFARQSLYFMSQETNGSESNPPKGWWYHTCYNYRAATDDAQYVKGIKVGNSIKFRAGFNVYATAGGNGSVNGQASGLKTYVIVDASALALVASTIMTVAAVSHLTF